MTKIGKLWTDSVAYVALLAGAGLSIAGNVANVVRTRGEATDALDIVLAVAFPALVVLMVEVFVSSRWHGLAWPMQVLRWAGCLAIGAVAMRVSWVHLHELMDSRGQKDDVATFGPLAIDALAIMATALILAGRGRATVRDMSQDMSRVTWPVQPATVATQADVDETEAILSNPGAYLSTSVANEARTWLDTLEDSALDNTTTAAYPISPAPMSNTVRPESVPADAADLIMAWTSADMSERPAAGQADKLVAAAMGRDARTARRWRYALTQR
jgi:hypothetical protein